MDFLTDTHCHLYLPELSADLESVIEAATQQKVRKILIPGIDSETNRKAIDLASRFPGQIYAAVGMHPNSKMLLHGDVDHLKSLIRNYPIHAIGEIGLDYHRKKNSRDDQVAVLRLMLDAAAEFNLPICLHNRDADDDMLRILDDWYSELIKCSHPLVNRPGVFHAFSGSSEISAWAIDHHFYFGICGVVTYEKAADLRYFVQKTDLGSLLLETDAPYLAPHPYRGKRNAPKNVLIVAEKIAEIKQIPLSDVMDKTSRNAAALFEWKDSC